MEQEALEFGLLLSKQEQEYGKNMYDVMAEVESDTVAELEKKGFTKAEAALILFEEKFGKVSGQPKDMKFINSLPTTDISDVPVSEDNFDINDKQSVKLLMENGYTQEQAIAEHLRRQKK